MLRSHFPAVLSASLIAALASCTNESKTVGADASPPAESPVAFRATGNEPGWRLDIGRAEMVLLTNFGQERLVVATPKADASGGTIRYVARTKGGELVVAITDRLCVDSMSGMPHPQTVEVVTGDRNLVGCGGEPVSLLQGAEWSVFEIDGAPIVAGSQTTLGFAADGQLAGQASCNKLTGGYSLSGEGLAISPGSGTPMTCDEAILAQERRFLAALGKVQGFSITADGLLLLRTGDGGSIRARRP